MQSERQQPQAAAAVTAPAASSAPNLAPPVKLASGLPPGWGQATDASSGRTYYFHSVTGEMGCLCSYLRRPSPCMLLVARLLALLALT